MGKRLAHLHPSTALRPRSSIPGAGETLPAPAPRPLPTEEVPAVTDGSEWGGQSGPRKPGAGEAGKQEAISERQGGRGEAASISPSSYPISLTDHKSKDNVIKKFRMVAIVT